MSESIEERWERRLDLDTLEQYYDLVGPGVLENSIGIFEKVMPEYLSSLQAELAEGNDQAAAKVSHKIKGAAGSIGLKQVQQLAQKGQHLEEAGWQAGIRGWAEQMATDYPADLALLKAWLADQDEEDE